MQSERAGAEDFDVVVAGAGIAGDLSGQGHQPRRAAAIPPLGGGELGGGPDRRVDLPAGGAGSERVEWAGAEALLGLVADELCQGAALDRAEAAGVRVIPEDRFEPTLMRPRLVGQVARGEVV